VQEFKAANIWGWKEYNTKDILLYYYVEKQTNFYFTGMTGYIETNKQWWFAHKTNKFLFHRHDWLH
jgi:hypothetical protein